MKYLHVLRGSVVSKKALLGTAAISLLAAPLTLFAQEDEEEPEEEEKIRIVGSRISRIDAEPISPVTRLTAEDLRNTGFSTVGDALRAVPANTGQSLTPDDASTSFTPGVSTFNLRGLGNNNTLVLINGIRGVPFAQPGFNGFQSVFDFNSLPIDAVEEIQILKDGGSAIYGSDAVAGVINIELAKDFEGLSTQVYYGNTTGTDSAEKKLFAISGTSSAKTSIVTTFDYQSRNAVNTADLPISSNANTKVEGDTELFGGFITVDPASLEGDGPILTTGIDWRSSRPYPARFSNLDGSIRGTFSSPSTAQDPNSVVPWSNATGDGYYNYNENVLLYPEFEQYGFYTRIEHEMSDTLTAYADMSYRRIEVYNYAAPAPFAEGDNGDGNFRVQLPEGYDTDADPDGLILEGDRILDVGNELNPFDTQAIYRNVPGALVLPVENPYNPFDEDVQILRWRLINGSVRENDLIVDYPRLVAGLKGEIGFTWEWDSYLTYQTSSAANRNGGTAFDDRLQESLRGVVNPNTGETEYSNPFGPEPDWIGTYYTGTNPTRADFDMLQFSASAAGEIIDMPAGAAGLAFGFEYRDESLTDVRTTNNESGNIIGGSEGFGTEGGRDITAIYTELDLPLLETVDVQIAARHEDYSDFGTTTKPKIGAKWRASDWILVRGSYSEAFKAPDIAVLSSQGQVSFTSRNFNDPLRPGDSDEQMKQVTPGNPDLLPEETDVYYAGFVVEFGKVWEKLDGLEFSVDYFKFDQENLLTQASTQDILDNELNPAFPGGEVVRRPLIPGSSDPVTGEPYTVGVIENITRPFFNADEYIYEGVDFDVRYSWETEELGDFRFRASATVLLENQTTTIDPTTGERFEFANSVGTWNGLSPKWRSSASLAWNRDDWAATLFMQYVSGLDYSTWFESNFGLGGYIVPDVGSYVSFSPQISYQGFWDTNITLGVRNIFDEEPPRDITATNGGYLSGVYPWEPRFLFLRFQRDF